MQKYKAANYIYTTINHISYSQTTINQLKMQT